MPTKIVPVLENLSDAELREAKKVHPTFHSLHEGYAILLEEMEEAKEDFETLERYRERLWSFVRTDNNALAKDFAARIADTAVHLASEAIQTAAMAKKLLEFLSA